MDRRELLGFLGAGAAGLVALDAGATPPPHDNGRDGAHDACLKACRDCASVCEEAFRHGLKLLEQGKKGAADAVRLALDCAEFCALSAKLIARQGALTAEACAACADACKRCGDECARSDDAVLKACAEACRRCERTCREMAKAVPHAHHG